jgi:Lectin C-type domain
MKNPSALAAILLVLWARSLPASIEAGPFTCPANGHTYYLLSSNTWTGAEAEAVSLGGHLTTINDLAENDWVYQTFANYGGIVRGLWIGLNDAAQEGNFVWASGEPVSFTHWGLGEPNNSGGNENYVHFINPPDSRVGFWNDAPNVNEALAAYGVVELPTVVAATNVMIWTAVEIGWLSETNRNYQVQQATNLLSPYWQNVGPPVSGNGSTNFVFGSTRFADKKFYRVLIVP